jgi:hypothetical protein
MALFLLYCVNQLLFIKKEDHLSPEVWDQPMQDNKILPRKGKREKREVGRERERKIKGCQFCDYKTVPFFTLLMALFCSSQ